MNVSVTVTSLRAALHCAVCQLMNEFWNAKGTKEVGRLMMIDLGGAESMENATGTMLADARRLETKSMNQSMLTFGRVIQVRWPTRCIHAAYVLATVLLSLPRDGHACGS